MASGRGRSSSREKLPQGRRLYEDIDQRRRYDEPRDEAYPVEPYRGAFSRDLERLIHSPSFRRLQGKLQLFPGTDDDFFRNRLTHSLEVAQIARAIGRRLNHEESLLKPESAGPIDLDLLTFAGHAHDLGHPPFGHAGEKKLDILMKDHGGFEGNAQTLRILAHLEQKFYDTGLDEYEEGLPYKFSQLGEIRRGLNLSARTLAAIIKYDRKIPRSYDDRPNASRPGHQIMKGYYETESDLIVDIRQCLGLSSAKERIRTLECSIMDIADDIAYSTYDVEDAFKGGFLNPLDIATQTDEFKKKVIEAVNGKIVDYHKEYYNSTPSHEDLLDIKDYFILLTSIFGKIYDYDAFNAYEKGNRGGRADVLTLELSIEEFNALISSSVYKASQQLASSHYNRTKFTSELVGMFIRSVELHKTEGNQKEILLHPHLAQAKLKLEAFKKVEFLKTLTYQIMIESPPVKLIANKADTVLQAIWNKLTQPDGHKLLPAKWQEFVGFFEGEAHLRMRTLCDYVASLTDHACLKFYHKIYGSDDLTVR